MINEAKERQLVGLLKSFPHPDYTDEDRKWIIVAILMSAEENGWTDEFIKICEENPGATFDDVTKLIFTEERFPALEIVDDE